MKATIFQKTKFTLAICKKNIEAGELTAEEMNKLKDIAVSLISAIDIEKSKKPIKSSLLRHFE